MIVLAIRADQPRAELYLYKEAKIVTTSQWSAHRLLAATINKKIEEILNKSSISLTDLDGIVIFAGPGSFTGLRIAMSVANALAYAQQIPIVARSSADWIDRGIKDLAAGMDDRIGLPKYDRPAATTPPKK